MLTTSTDGFAAWFNEVYPGAHRRISAEDIRDMTAIGLIGRSSYYSPLVDGETIRGILQYEELRSTRPAKLLEGDKPESPRCRMCGNPLSPETEGKDGRPKEYCPPCEPSRNEERRHKYRLRHREEYRKAMA